VRSKVVVSVVAAIVAVPLFSVMSAASWFFHNSSVKSTTVNIVYNSKLSNGKMLKAGNYKLEIPLRTKTPDLKFYRYGKLVASMPAQVKKTSHAPYATEVDYTRKGGAEYITEIRPNGLREAYVIKGESTAKSGT
jgi:hypothetical protein